MEANLISQRVCWEHGDEDKWSATRWARMMELALRRIVAKV
jgi:hypothetical protein